MGFNQKTHTQRTALAAYNCKNITKIGPRYSELPSVNRHDWHLAMSKASGVITEGQTKHCHALFDSGKWTLRAAMVEVVGREKTEAYYATPQTEA